MLVRRGSGQLVAEVALDGEPYIRLAGDGVIVATALGSSGYTMAAGGPLLTLRTAAFVCTPIAMHGGSAPPLVVPAESVLTVEVHRATAASTSSSTGSATRSRRTRSGSRSSRTAHAGAVLGHRSGLAGCASAG